MQRSIIIALASLSFLFFAFDSARSFAKGEEQKSQDLCPVMGHKIDSKVYTDYQGRRIYFCCTECVKKFKANPAAYQTKTAAQSTVPASGARRQTECPVMGMKITPGVYIDYKGKRVSFCCPSCLEKFNANPEELIRKMEADGVVFEKSPSAKSVTPGQTEKGKGEHQH